MTEWVGDAVHGHLSHRRAAWTPKVGDRVTVAGDDREWVVEFVGPARSGSLVTIGGATSLVVLPSMLTPAPTPPPEPPRYVRHAGRFYTRGGVAEPYIEPQAPVLIDPADDAQVKAAGLCRVDEVEAWMSVDLCQTWLPKKFRERFGKGDGA